MKMLILCFLLVACLGQAASVPAQEPQEDEKPWLELSFSRVSGRAGEEVSLPIYVTSNVNVKEAITIFIPFANRKLEFKKLETGLLARKAGWTLNSRVKASAKDLSGSMLEISIDPGEGTFFPNGVIAYARFAIRKLVPKGDINLEASLKLASATPVQIKKVEPAKINVYVKPIYGCFFYMH